ALTPLNIMSYTSTKVSTTAFKDQKPGTSGLRKPTKTFQVPNYTENFIQSILSSQNVAGTTLVVGGDGRYFGREAIQLIIQISAANQVSKLLVGQHGILSTPAVSNIIRKYKALGGILLTASHNPGGPDADFGIKYNGSNGGPAVESVTSAIYDISLKLKQYDIADIPQVDIDTVGTQTFQVDGREFVVEVIDAVADYVELMKEIFDFEKLKASRLPILINCMNGVTGPYAERIFVEELGYSPESVIKSKPLPDFGGLHPDPNLTYAKDMVDTMKTSQNLQFGAAYDGDGDRNMILGQAGAFVQPGDSLAIIAANLQSIPYFQKTGITGVARSMPTSCAVDRVAKALNLKFYEVPTGWKFFGNLMDAGEIDLCGEESFGTGSTHVREKDGIWASLAWLSILAAKGSTIKEILDEHWKVYGRNFFLRMDYENVDSQKADNLMRNIEGQFGTLEAKCDSYSYVDPIDKSVTKNQGLRIDLGNGSRIIYRLSGTGSSGSTVRVYIEKYDTNYDQDVQVATDDIVRQALSISNLQGVLGVDAPTVVT
ncbi:unnamed protein product, partial [Allacma fusca]